MTSYTAAHLLRKLGVRVHKYDTHHYRVAGHRIWRGHMVAFLENLIGVG